ncbi:hypothetical protein HMPREF3144_00650 [Oligella sp. HMSC05A10]|nr:hypothetical protein CEQ07_10125 [Oligella urethralis]OFS89519.1 hypothetical protein HMPREF3144_00650 [Oligella sp. HMSC05A10]
MILLKGKSIVQALTFSRIQDFFIHLTRPLRTKKRVAPKNTRSKQPAMAQGKRPLGIKNNH